MLVPKKLIGSFGGIHKKCRNILACLQEDAFYKEVNTWELIDLQSEEYRDIEFILNEEGQGRVRGIHCFAGIFFDTVLLANLNEFHNTKFERFHPEYSIERFNEWMFATPWVLASTLAQHNIHICINTEKVRLRYMKTLLGNIKAGHYMEEKIKRRTILKDSDVYMRFIGVSCIITIQLKHISAYPPKNPVMDIYNFTELEEWLQYTIQETERSS